MITLSSPPVATYTQGQQVDEYTYAWKTSKGWAGTCRQLVLEFDADAGPAYDGARAEFNFRFK